MLLVVAVSAAFAVCACVCVVVVCVCVCVRVCMSASCKRTMRACAYVRMLQGDTKLLPLLLECNLTATMTLSTESAVEDR